MKVEHLTAASPAVPPRVSIILPTYNRAKFLPMALKAIKEQQWRDWELVIVDDGSKDNTLEVLRELVAGWEQPVRYVYQENQGAYGARNTGLDLARGEHVAFYDSDDVWLPHHLSDCVTALAQHPEIDWVYGSCRVDDFNTHKTLSPSIFYVNGKPRPFLSLRVREAGNLRIIEDDSVMKRMLTSGLYCGLQNSVIRRRVFDGMRFHTAYRNEAEDLLIVVRALARGRRFAYYDNVHVIYHVHDSNSSASGQGSLDKRLTVYRALLRGFEELGQQVRLSPQEQRALRESIGRVYFWELGYSLLWLNGKYDAAIEAYRTGLGYWPWNLACWKTYFVAMVRSRLGLLKAPSQW